VLAAVDQGCSTTELSRRVAVSIASASEHAAVLREAGLLHSRRQGSQVLHTVTSLGASLLTRSDG
jgi:DNA-binding transcriptional ArsR family regulator